MVARERGRAKPKKSLITFDAQLKAANLFQWMSRKVGPFILTLSCLYVDIGTTSADQEDEEFDMFAQSRKTTFDESRKG